MKALIFYSGGKDSQAALIWSIKEYGLNHCEAVFCDTGHEHPLTIKHINETTQQLGVKLTVLKSKKYDGMFDLAKKKGRFPSTKARFCTEELKSKPAIDYVLSHSEHLIVIEGIRKNESVSRSKMDKACTYFKYYFEPMLNGKKNTYRAKDVREWCKDYNADKLRPIFDWTAEQTLDFIKANNQQPNPLYYMGFKRVGCFPCIMANHSELKLIIEHHPEQWDLIKSKEKELGLSMFKPDYIPKWACTGIDKNGVKYPLASDIEKYLMRHDAQTDMFEKEIGCMSVYNLCE